MIPQNTQKKRTNTYHGDSILESLRDLSGSVGHTVANDVAGKVASDALSSLLGTKPTSGELHANESISLNQERRHQPAPRRIENHMQPRILSDAAEVKQKLDMVRAELKALTTSLKSLNQEVQKAIEEAPVDPGIYHVNFFDKLRSVLKLLREQIEDSRSWLALTTSKKQKKKYWGMYKKHGTQFGLSWERTSATQSG